MTPDPIKQAIEALSKAAQPNLYAADETVQSAHTALTALRQHKEWRPIDENTPHARTPSPDKIVIDRKRFNQFIEAIEQYHGNDEEFCNNLRKDAALIAAQIMEKKND